MTAQQIKSIRRRLGWPQERLARELGLSYSSISRWERGETTPSPAAMRLLSDLLRSAPRKTESYRPVGLGAHRIEISGVVGLFSGPKDLAVNHDRYLAGSRKRR